MDEGLLVQKQVRKGKSKQIKKPKVQHVPKKPAVPIDSGLPTPLVLEPELDSLGKREAELLDKLEKIIKRYQTLDQLYQANIESIFTPETFDDIKKLTIKQQTQVLEDVLPVNDTSK